MAGLSGSGGVSGPFPAGAVANKLERKPEPEVTQERIAFSKTVPANTRDGGANLAERFRTDSIPPGRRRIPFSSRVGGRTCGREIIAIRYWCGYGKQNRRDVIVRRRSG